MAPSRLAEITITVDGHTVAVHHARTFSIGESPAADFICAAAGADLIEVVRASPDGRLQAHWDGATLALADGHPIELEHGNIALRICQVTTEPLPRMRRDIDWRFWRYNAGSAALLGSFLLGFNIMPELAHADSLDSERLAFEWLREDDYLGRIDVEWRTPGPVTATFHATPGDPDAPKNDPLDALAQEDPDADSRYGGIPQMARNFDPDMMARSVGILGMVQQDGGHFLASPYGSAFAGGNEDEDVWGGLTGTEVGEAFGVGGLGLVGTGRGHSGTGDGTIGLGNVGLIGRGSGTGLGWGAASGQGASHDHRDRKVPRVRQGRPTVNSTLDKDIIRRIVRAHINEVRHCYNEGLTRNPALGGGSRFSSRSGLAAESRRAS